MNNNKISGFEQPFLEGQFNNYRQRLFISSIVYGAALVCHTSIDVSDVFLKQSINTTLAFPHVTSVVGCSFSDPVIK